MLLLTPDILVLVLVDFQDNLVQCKLLDYILDILSRVVIWNVNY